MKRLLLLAVAAALPLASCGRSHEPAAPATQGPPVSVRIVRLGGGSAEALVLPARVTAREEITVTARMGARLTALPLREGDRFRRGQTLARFEAAETRAGVESARAGFEAATFRREIARLQEARMESLLAVRVAALREVEGARADRRAAEAAWAQARAQLQELRSGVTLEAPFDGVVVRRHADVGTTLGPGQALLDIRSTEAGEIAASIPESELGRLEAGHAEIQVGDGPWQPARVTRVDGMTDFTTRSRTARFLPLSGRLEPGAFARVRLSGTRNGTGRDDVQASRIFSVPSRALVRRGGLTGVFVVDDGTARLRWLRTGREEAGRIEVLAGLEPADQVIDDPGGLADGRAVRTVH